MAQRAIHQCRQRFHHGTGDCCVLCECDRLQRGAPQRGRSGRVPRTHEEEHVNIARARVRHRAHLAPSLPGRRAEEDHRVDVGILRYSQRDETAQMCIRRRLEPGDSGDRRFIDQLSLRFNPLSVRRSCLCQASLITSGGGQRQQAWVGIAMPQAATAAPQARGRVFARSLGAEQTPAVRKRPAWASSCVSVLPDARIHPAPRLLALHPPLPFCEPRG
jgi:hypothetical protein